MSLKKPVCMTKNCGKTSQYDEAGSSLCIGCISTNSRKHASHKKMEHHILSDITRGIRKALPSYNLTMRYDQVYHEGLRPDLMINNQVNDNIVMVEVDEWPHFTEKHLKEDRARFKTFYDKTIKDGSSLSVVRIVPGENTASSMFKTEKAGKYNVLKKTNGFIEKNPENYNKYIKESVSKIVDIIKDKEGYKYKDMEVSIGPTVKKNSSSPIFSDTSSPDVSSRIGRARSIFKEDQDNSESLVPLFQGLSFNVPSTLSSQFENLSINKSYEVPKTKVFSKNQKRQIVDMIQKHKDISSYVSSITGRKYKSSNIKLTDKDPIEVHLHVIQGASLGYKDSEILKGAEKLRKESEFRKKSFFQYQKSGNFPSIPALPKKSPGLFSFLGF
jgi:hypothetical protein